METPAEPVCHNPPATTPAPQDLRARRNWFAIRLVPRSRTRWFILVAILAATGCAAWFAVPHVLAWRDFRAGREALERFHTEAARDHFNACLRVWPNSAETHRLAARAARRLGDLQESRDQLRECQRLEGTASDETVLEWALLGAASGELDKFEPLLLVRMQKDVALAPLIWEALAQGCIARYRLLEATGYLDLWLDHDPDNVQALFLRGVTRQQAGAAATSADDFRRVVELDSERDDARRGLARSLLKVGHYDEALTQFELLYKRRPTDTEILVNLARCQTELGQRDEARSALESVLADRPDNGQALKERARLALREGQLTEAETWSRRAVAANPNDYYSNWQLYESLRLQGRNDEADAQLTMALKIQERAERLGEIQTRLMSQRPNDPALHCELGTLFISAGYKELGEKWLRSALYQDEHYGPAHTALADLYEERGDFEQAAEQRRLAEAAPVQAPATPKP